MPGRIQGIGAWTAQSPRGLLPVGQWPPGLRREARDRFYICAGRHPQRPCEEALKSVKQTSE